MKNFLALYKSSLKFLEPLSVKATYKEVITEGKKLVDGNYGSIFFYDHGKLKRIFTTTPKNLQKKPRDNGLSYKAFLTGIPQVHSMKDLQKVYPDMLVNGTKSLVLVPLIYKNKTMGMFSMHAKKNVNLMQETSTLLQLFGSMCTLSIYKAKMEENIKQTLAERNMFIALASHELKTPLTTINIYAQIIKKSVDQNKMPLFNSVSTLSSEIKRVNRLVDELLQSKKGNLSYRMTSCNVNDILLRVSKITQLNYPNYNIIIKKRRLNNNTYIYADFDKIIQVITNIVNNAVKFSFPSYPIIIEFSENTNKIIITIQDKGKGIKEEDLPKIFKVFYKGRENTKEGLGLGLFLAKKIIYRHHGKISVKSILNKGTVFSISLPKLSCDN